MTKQGFPDYFCVVVACIPAAGHEAEIPGNRTVDMRRVAASEVETDHDKSRGQNQTPEDLNAAIMHSARGLVSRGRLGEGSSGFGNLLTLVADPCLSISKIGQGVVSALVDYLHPGHCC